MEKSTLKQRARDLRKNSTDAERHFWYHLRAKRLGFKFKRQVPIGAYIIDFVCMVGVNRFFLLGITTCIPFFDKVWRKLSIPIPPEDTGIYAT